MDIFEKLRSGEPVDMMSEEYQPVIAELTRANIALFRLNHTEPMSKQYDNAVSELFDGNVPAELGFFTPIQIDFPRQMKFGKKSFHKPQLYCNVHWRDQHWRQCSGRSTCDNCYRQS